MNSKPHKNIKSIQHLFEGKPENIVIIGHTYPDGDTVGSGLALKEYLLQRKHNVSFVLPDMYPDFFSWMHGAKEILIYNKSKNKVKALINSAKILIFVDLNSVARLKSLQNFVQTIMNSKISVLFDHHSVIDTGFTYLYWESGVSSVAELIYEYICKTGNKKDITRSMAENLYTGILTDTGSFSYSCNNPKTYSAIFHFYKLGIDGAYINQQIYSSFRENRMRILGYSLLYKLKVFEKYGGAYIALDTDDLKKFDFKTGDTEGLVNFAVNIKDIYFAALLTTSDKYIKISFRSKGDINVNNIAKKFFDGGGHKNASGAYFYGTFQEACSIIENIITKELK